MAEITQITDMIAQLRQGDDSALTRIYQEVRPQFISWSAREFDIPESDSVELFQLSMVIFYDNVMSGKLEKLTSQVKTYVFAIAKNKARELIRKKRKEVPLMEAVHDYAMEDEIIAKEQVEQQLNLIRKHINRLGEKCQNILRLFYYQKLDMPSIARLLNYNTASTAKNMKYKCLMQLRNMITK